MIGVITPFSFFNDGPKAENSRIFPDFDAYFGGNFGFGNPESPFSVIFTEKNV